MVVDFTLKCLFWSFFILKISIFVLKETDKQPSQLKIKTRWKDFSDHT